MPLKNTYNPKVAEAVWWNLLLLTVGSAIYAVGVQAVAVPHGFVSGGVVGMSMITLYSTGLLSVPIWYAIYCIPVCIVGWFFVGRIFLLYSIYAVAATSLFGALVTFEIPVQDPLHAAVLAGVLMGAGGGTMLRSLGSAGGTDIIAVALRERWNISVGRFSFTFNICLFIGALLMGIAIDTIIASTIMIFINANVLEAVLRMFNQRKMVIIISSEGERLCEAIMVSQQFGVTLMRGKGGYLGNDKEVLLTVTNNMALKQLESIVFNIDEHAIFIVENTFYVSGGQFARKIYK